ncbi:MAG TPA: WecB/TagA/CpsF family glycosyltransferase [Lacibacter sp.]|nr:WecB/TagA/CpsF family glycosyltransferase [Lacibacter sp.]HMO90231.1 WecB/TagA/CpsF family glycosyltransferase [Lacibacter sp.]HMP86606.1 WecB/TagA/CpsF family glycosyltransferase [Lacibacter sp.]
MLLDYPVFRGTLHELPDGSPVVINTLNQYSYCVAEQDPAFKKALVESDVLLPDGVGVTASLRLLAGIRLQKIAGADLHLHFLRLLNQTGGSCFYLGSSEKTLQKIRERLHREYPRIKVDTYSPPFKPVFEPADNQAMLEAINEFKPDVLFIGLTAPKQEKWAAAHKPALQAGYVCSIGAVFDFFAGTVERPGPFWIRMGLEWLIRLLKEPKRMWRRYLYYGPLFVLSILQQKIRQLIRISGSRQTV